MVPKDELFEKLTLLKEIDTLAISEIFFLSTCNRVEFIFSTALETNEEYVSTLLNNFYSDFALDLIYHYQLSAVVYQGVDAVTHLFKVSASLDSMLLGEREIIRQLRESYEYCRNLGLTGDLLRLVMNQVVKTSKEIYTNTRIAEKPVSVASLAARKLLNYNLPFDAPIVIIGAGETIALVTSYLAKKGYSNFRVYNRSLFNAKTLTQAIGGTAHELSTLGNEPFLFDVLITCTSAQEPIVNAVIWENITKNDDSKKVIIDLAIPNDVSETVQRFENVKNYISVDSLKNEIEENISFRQKEVLEAEKIISANLISLTKIIEIRELELSMGSYPEHIKTIRKNAMDNVFAKELIDIDESSLELINRMMDYMEKKCISVPMIIAKQTILNVETGKTRMPGSIKI